jgi:hypothetical protein
MRWLARILGGLVLLALLALGALWWRLDALAERMIERGATERLGVATEVDGLLLRPLSGVLTLRGLRVANPPGFSGDFLRVERARGEVDVATLRGEVVELPEIVLSGVELALEETPGGSNYDAILASLGRGEQNAGDGEGPSVRVRELLIRDVVAHVRVGPAPPVTLAIPEIRLAELGGRGGTSAGQVTAEIVRAILVAVATEAPGMPVALAGRLLTGLGLSGAAELLQGVGERGLDAARDALRRILE